MTHQYSDALLSKADGIATITLNRPQKLNAFTQQMEDDVRAAIADVRNDPEMRVVVLTGSGRAFCAGADVNAWDQRIREGGQPSVVDRWRQNEARHAMSLGLHELNKPVIAAVNGAAVGMGMDVALACDMRIAAESARMGMLYIKRGLVPDEGGAWFLPRLVGLAKAYELIFTGDMIAGPEAERIGLVNRCVPDAELAATTRELAEKIAGGPPIALEFAKRAVREGLGLPLRSHLDAIGYYMRVLDDTEDVAEGMRAFVERRAPAFTGR
ncbi:MAG: enoyl-CoA hydratase/isomerase family protein [Dehalococcoidia bacterium]